MIPARGRPDTGDPVDQRLGHTGAMTTQIGGSLVVAYCGDEEAERRTLPDEPASVVTTPTEVILRMVWL